MSDLIRALVAGVLASLLAGCPSARSVQTHFGSKTIFIDPNASVESLRVIMNDWEDVVDAIYQYRPKRCVRENLTIDSLESLGTYQGREREKYLSLGGINESKEMAKVLSVGTKDPCLVDPSSSGPGWIILYSNGVYKVLDEISLSE